MKNKSRSIEVKRVLCEQRNPYPADDLIETYKDFLKERYYLHTYKFNPVVFTKLLRLTVDSWHTEKRISRYSLLFEIVRYKLLANPKNISTSSIPRIYPIDFPPEICSLLFELFQLVLKFPEKFSENQLLDSVSFAFRLMTGIRLNEEHILFLLENVKASDKFLNRVLRYPYYSPLISKWAKEHFEAEEYRLRRAELISQILNENPDFEVDFDTLITDFEYMNYLDFQTVNKGIEVSSPYFIKDLEYKGEIGEEVEKGSNIIEYSISSNKYISFDDNFVKRFYEVPKRTIKGRNVPDFPKMTTYFLDNKKKILNSTMAWGIAYSCYSNQQKSEMLRKYYNEETHPSIIRICKIYKLTEMLEWIYNELTGTKKG